MSLSVIILTNNSEEIIEGCLKSVSWAEEVLIIDSFSKDNTLKICQKYTDKIYQFEWKGYVEQRNKAIELSTKDWILFLDADERIALNLKEELLKKNYILKGYNGYYIRIANFLLGKWLKFGGWYPDWHLRLFKKGKGFYPKLQVHENLKIEGKIGYIFGDIIHLSHRSISELITKVEKYTTLEAQELFENKKYSYINIPLLIKKSFEYFWKHYIKDKGYKDGLEGFIETIILSFYTFLIYAKLWELQNHKIKDFYKNFDPKQWYWKEK